MKWLAITNAVGVHFHDRAGADPGFRDVLRCRFSTEGQGDIQAKADLMIHCQERDLALPLNLAVDLIMQHQLVSRDP